LPREEMNCHKPRGEVYQVQWNLFLHKDAFHHGAILTRPLKADRHRLAAFSILVVLKETQDAVIDLDREIMHGTLYFFFNILTQLGIDGRRECGNLPEIVNCRVFPRLIRKTVTVSYRCQLHGMDPGDEFGHFASDTIIP
jgi:hypothetical protein